MSRGTAKDVATVIGVAGELVGRTRLQKTISLIEMAGLGYGFDFNYYKYGPYSEDLAVSVDRAVDLRYVKEVEKRANWGGRYSIFQADRVLSSGERARDDLIRLAASADAVALELAVTAAFLAQEGIEKPWDEVASRKPEKSNERHLADAKGLYARFLNVPDLPKPLPLII